MLTAQVKNDSLIDVYDVLNHIFKIEHKKKSLENKDIDKGTISLVPGFGYSQLKGVAYVVEANYSFKSTENSNVSIIYIVPEITQKGYVIPRVTTSIWLKDNKFNFSSDWRFYKYVAENYGMGSETYSNLANLYKFNYIRFHNVMYKKVRPSFMLGIGYNLDVHYKIKAINKELPMNSQGIDVSQKTSSSGLVFNLLHDTRKNENFPVGGERLFCIGLTQNFKKIGSTYSNSVLISDIRLYHSFNASNVLAFRSFNWFVLGKKFPYFDQATALGDMKNSISRPYIEGRFRGKKLVYFETEYRFKVTKNELIGAAFFGNIQSFSEPVNNEFESVNAAFGGSLRVKINKVSKVYLVFSYGIGTNGGHGIFLSLGDVF